MNNKKETITREVKTFNYNCIGYKNDCPYCDKRGMLQIDVEVDVIGFNNKMPTEDFYCPNEDTPKKLKLVGQALSKMHFIKLNDAQIKADRMARSRKDFKDNVFPTLSMEDKRIHARKDPELAKRLK